MRSRGRGPDVKGGGADGGADTRAADLGHIYIRSSLTKGKIVLDRVALAYKDTTPPVCSPVTVSVYFTAVFFALWESCSAVIF